MRTAIRKRGEVRGNTFKKPWLSWKWRDEDERYSLLRFAGARKFWRGHLRFSGCTPRHESRGKRWVKSKEREWRVFTLTPFREEYWWLQGGPQGARQEEKTEVDRCIIKVSGWKNIHPCWFSGGVSLGEDIVCPWGEQQDMKTEINLESNQGMTMKNIHPYWGSIGEEWGRCSSWRAQQ